MRFWERMAESKLPLLAHTGGEHTLPVVRPEFADPRILTLPLECRVTVIAAHCGACMVIGRKNKTRTPAIQSLVKQLTKSTVKIAGVLMNDY